MTRKKIFVSAIVVTSVTGNLKSKHTSCDSPNDWKKATTSEGYTYFYNEKTGASQWESQNGTWNYDWDKQPKSKAKVVHQIILIRHGQYTVGESKEVLTAIGRQQARETGKRLKFMLDEGVVPPIKNIYYSTMPRAKETHDIMLDEMTTTAPSSPCSMIREGAVARPNPPTNPSWTPTDASFEEGEARAYAAFKAYFKRASALEDDSYSTVLVGHGNMIRYLVMKALQFPPEGWTRLRVYNGSITVVEIRSDGVVTLKALGDTGHFAPDQITDNEKNTRHSPK